MKPELLSPAGDSQSLDAALKAGADAVYLGGPRFSARAYAANFTNQDLSEAIRQCHRQGVKIYITINTLLKDNELLEAYRYAVQVWNMGVDAIIIQDTGLIRLLNAFHPDIELHASTQMTVHQKKAADFLSRKGLTRIVLSRELSLEEIRDISEQHETEVFIHGALCISYSGKCLMSSMLGGRSGNRGRCAQNCRMEYDLIDAAGKNRAQGFLMSPKDLSTLDITDEMMATGTASFKIEGRMKRPEYVYETVRQYRRALNGETADPAGITQLFNREGFSHAFLLGNDGKDMMAYHSPKNSGVGLGRVRQGQVRLQIGLSLGDGLQAGESGFIVTKLRVGGTEVRSAKAGDTCEIFPKKYRDGDFLIKTQDSVLMRTIHDELRQPLKGVLPLRMKARFVPGEAFSLQVFYQDQALTVVGETVEEVQSNPLLEQRLRENLAKTGGTPFEVESLEIDYESGFLRMSFVNETRRKALEQAEQQFLHKIRNESPAPEAQLKALSLTKAGKTDVPVYFVVLSTKDQLRAYLDETSGGRTKEIVPVLSLWQRREGSLDFSDAKALDGQGIPFWIRLPEIMKTEFDGVIQAAEHFPNLSGILTGHMGAIEHFKDRPLKLAGDYKLNIMNSWADLLFEELDITTVSEELNYREMISLDRKPDRLVILYGRTELMLSEYCPVGALAGGRAKGVPCSAPCEAMDFMLKDRKGEEFPVQTDAFCRSSIMNSKTKNNLDQQKLLKTQGFAHFRADLTTESYEEARRVITALKKGESLYLPEVTRGHYKRGVE